MLTLETGTIEYYNSKTNEFIYENGGVVRFEYSLKVLYEWEGKWKKPFLKDKGNITPEEMFDFCKMMALDEIDDKFLTDEVIYKIGEYIKDNNTATTFANHDGNQNGNNNSRKGKIYTSEELYALMFVNGIPIEFENRNLNRLLTILRIIGTQSQEPKKMNKNDILRQNATLNAQRKARMKTKG